MSVTVRIQNAYSDGHQSEHTVELDTPDGDLDDWFEDVVFPETGDGHGAGTNLGSCYTATIIAADGVELINGATHEWSD